MRDDLPTDPVQRLLMAAAGRRDYIREDMPQEEKDALEANARAFEWAIDIIQNDTALAMAVHSGFIWPPEKRKALLAEAAERLIEQGNDT